MTDLSSAADHTLSPGRGATAAAGPALDDRPPVQAGKHGPTLELAAKIIREQGAKMKAISERLA